MNRIAGSLLFCAASALLLLGGSGRLVAQQNRWVLRAPNGIGFAEIRGYEDWKAVAPSFRTDNDEIRVILANDTMISAYRSGAPADGRPFPEGSIIVKIGYSEKKSPSFPAALVPDVLKRVEFIVKDSRRFPDTAGWGFARFVFDAGQNSFAPFGKDASFAQQCFTCHTAVKDQDFIFTAYPPR